MVISMISNKHYKIFCFLIILALTIHSIAYGSTIHLSDSSSQYYIRNDMNKPIVLYANIIPLAKNFRPIYINISVNLGYGEMSFELKNFSYEFRVYVNGSLKKPFVTVNETNHSLLIVDHTPRIIEITPVIPCKIVVVPEKTFSSELILEVKLLFSNKITYRDILPDDIRGIFEPAYLFKNGVFYSINDTVSSLNNITLVVKLDLLNNYAEVNGSSVGFFPLYINIPTNARDIEKLCDNGILKFSYNGFYGDILNYLGHRLFLQYSGPHMPLEIISDSCLTIREIGRYEYIYLPEPLYLVKYNGFTVTVPVTRDIFVHPWIYNASYIVNHIRGFRLVRENYEWHNIVKHYPLCDIQYLYKYPVSGDVVLPLPAKNQLLNASLILISNLRLSQQNYSLIENYNVGYIPSKYLTIRTGSPLQTYLIITLIVLPTIIIAFTVMKRWLKKEKY